MLHPPKGLFSHPPKGPFSHPPKVSSHLLLLFQLYTFLALILLLFAFTLSFLALALLLLIITLLLLILTLSCYLRHELLVLVPQSLGLSFSCLEYLECGCCSCFSVCGLD